MELQLLTIHEQGGTKYHDLSDVVSRKDEGQRMKRITDLRHTDKSQYFAITKLNNNIVLPFNHQINFLMNIFISEVICHFSCKSDCKKEKSVVSFMHEQNIICSQTQLDDIAHEQTIIRRQFFVGHMADFQPIKRKKFFLNFFLMLMVKFKSF